MILIELEDLLQKDNRRYKEEILFRHRQQSRCDSLSKNLKQVRRSYHEAECGKEDVYHPKGSGARIDDFWVVTGDAYNRTRYSQPGNGKNHCKDRNHYQQKSQSFKNPRRLLRALIIASNRLKCKIVSE